MTHNDTLSANRLIPGIIHDIRLENAVYHIETSRFGPDAREHLHMAKNGRILTNLFQLGTATVQSADGLILSQSVVARSASRAVASVSIRHIRAGGAPVSLWDVTMTNKRGATHSETIHHGFDHVSFRDDSIGDEKSNIITTDAGKMSNNLIDDVIFHKYSSTENCPVCGRLLCNSATI